MTDDDLEKIIRAVLQRGASFWSNPSGAVIDLLRQFAHDNKVYEVSTTCRSYFNAYPGASTYVAAALPSILVNHYPPLLELAGRPEFTDWCYQNKNWADRIVDNAASDSLKTILDDIVLDVKEFIQARRER